MSLALSNVDMDRDHLKQYIESYGEVRAMEDIASIFHELGNEWAEAGNKRLRFVFSDASVSCANVAAMLKQAEQQHAVEQGSVTQEQIAIAQTQYEYSKLFDYFNTLSLSDLKTTFTNNRQELVSKLKRFEFLRKLLEKNKNDKQ